jgi:outer membrane protein assembly factor BamE (lipoprotein component of BamABCDE complex)
VYFQNDRVTGWRNGYPKLNARLLPDSPRPIANYLTLGSTKDDVIYIQGTPDSFSANTFRYGSSFVYFQNDRITGWRNGLPKLNVRLVPSSPRPVVDYFTVDYTKDDVIQIQGTPDSFSANSFSYGSSFVYFQNDRVTGWRNGYPRLSARLLASSQPPTADYFTIGSSKDDVIYIQGTPDSFSLNSFSYGSSFVYFQNDHVTSWRNGYPRLKVRL